ncbi:PQQ-dependent sugar dehydrogenase [Flavobacterium sp. NG2]|uniref:PQQ-dependent sugar dehydrogenase n=1 Tax=Flavobacterium sp. NG2 TaxID=3097547 RepID=UPI002A804977|nr:PQQ-dependent sugar dehydrogenase [Flavobacterium sp. NG2]WPR73218.1 PQQ-dependent sugar dehydrogenase [Flavobacterium sp. NG2]
MSKICSFFFIFFILSCSSQVKHDDILLADEEVKYRFESVATGISIPWGMVMLADGSLLVTEKSGTLFHVKNGVNTEIKNTPDVFKRGQGGLLDIALHPNYEKTGWIYFTYSYGLSEGANTKLIRAKLVDGSLTQIEDLYTAAPDTNGPNHFGSRIAFDNEGHLYFSIGERNRKFDNPQDINRDGGKIYRLLDDGKIPTDNPFVGKAGAKEAIYSYGHRNPQGVTKNPTTGEIWTHEHGPKGGDEINIIKKGANYGWPVITYGINYDGSILSDITEKAGMEQPLYYWTPSIAPCGMTFVTGDKYPDWKGHLLVGSLKFQYLELLKLNGNTVIKRQKIATDIGRVRNVIQGHDGYLYLAVEQKGIFRIIPN